MCERGIHQQLQIFVSFLTKAVVRLDGLTNITLLKVREPESATEIAPQLEMTQLENVRLPPDKVIDVVVDVSWQIKVPEFPLAQ